MRRRDFIKSSILASLSFSIFLKIVLSNKIEINSDEAIKWYAENRIWLIDWLNNVRDVNDFKGMQIFKTVGTDVLMKVADSEDYIWHELTRDHFDIILFTAVFGKKNNIRFDNGVEIQYMSGFLEQVGRLPKKNDEVLFESYLGRWFKFKKTFDGYVVVSECRLKVL
ncbi:MAG: hypothetical protein ACP6IQ_10630 [Candidatus Njordarchaeia archaeon]